MSFEILDLDNPPFGKLNLIEASAGTGKTYTISELYLWHILKGADVDENPGDNNKQTLNVENILVVTFTDAATAELKERIRNRLKDAISLLQNGNQVADVSPLPKKMFDTYSKPKSLYNVLRVLKSSVSTFDLSSIFTIHSFCQRMLVENAFESGALFNAEFITDESEIVRKVIEDFWRDLVYNESETLLPFIIDRIDIESLIGFYNKFSNYPEIRIVPEKKEIDKDKFENELSELNIIFKSLGKLWLESSKSTKEFFAKSLEGKLIDGRKYNKKKVHLLLHC